MRQLLVLPHFHPPQSRPRPGTTSTPKTPPGDPELRRAVLNDKRWQAFKDKLAVAAVLLLLLATITVFILYLVQQAPHFGSGELTGFARPAPGAVQAAANAGLPGADAANSVAGSGLGRIPLILISTAVEMAIFVALGLYLRHDMNRKP